MAENNPTKKDSYLGETMRNEFPLEGIKIIDAGSIIAGPLATSLLADFGAEVITIEHPDGDPVRDMNPKKDGVSLTWKVYHRNKRAITLDLSTDEGGKILKDLVDDADVLVENFRPGTMEKWGLSYDELSSDNDNLIMLRISGFGQSGPYKERAGFGRISGAMGGMVNQIGDPEGPPIFPSYPLEDSVTGIYAAYGIMVAIFNQYTSSGKGQVIDLSMAETMLHTNAMMPVVYDQLGNIPRRHGNTQPNVAPNSVYETKDNEYVVIPASNQNAWEKLCHGMDRRDLLENNKFKTPEDRVENSDEINGIVRDWVSNHTRNAIETTFDNHDVIYSFIYNIEDIKSDEHFEERNAITKVDDDELGSCEIQNVVPKLTETPGQIETLGPRKGEHNEEVYVEELNYSDEYMNELSEKGVI